MGLITELKDIALILVGEWVCEDYSHKVVFHFSDTLLREADLTIINSNGEKSLFKYTLAVLPTTDEDGNFRFFLDAGAFNNINFLIKEISLDKLILASLNNFKEQDEKAVYIRIKDSSFADQIIQGIN